MRCRKPLKPDRFEDDDEADDDICGPMCFAFTYLGHQSSQKRYAPRNALLLFTEDNHQRYNSIKAYTVDPIIN
jgi:hypothetical protein